MTGPATTGAATTGAAMTGAATTGGAVAAELAGVTAFLLHEADLLDQRRLDEWVELFAPDGHLWVPGRTAQDDATTQVSIIYDDVPRLRARVARLLSGKEYAQDPPSSTVRQVTNVQVTRSGDDGEIAASAVLVVYETRGRGGPLLVLPGRARYRLRPATRSEDGAGGVRGDDAPFRIVEKRFDLLEVARHFETLAFLL
jgi:benzoate/toluate 1,2-dioxygenase beta subunit